MAQSLHLLPDLVKPQCPLAIVHIWLMNQGLFFFVLGIFLTPTPFRAHIARWCAESNQPMNLVKDREFIQLMKAGRPGTSIPTPMTVRRDINLSFMKCREQIDKILKVHLTFNIIILLYLYIFRNTWDIFTLQQMLGLCRIIVLLWRGWFICIMRVVCWPSFWIS